MAYLLTNATDWRSLMSEIYSFATGSAGWTGSYDQSTRTSGDQGQIGIYSDPCYVAIGEQPSLNPFARSDEVNGGTVDDSFLFMALSTSLTAGNTRFWGHPGSIVTTSTDGDRVNVNDLDGPFDRVWLFSGAAGDVKYIWCVTEEATNNRFTHFGFGIIDKLGMTHPDVAFASGLRYVWWPNDADYTAKSNYGPNNPAAITDGEHSVGVFGDNPSGKITGHLYIKTNTLPSGFPAGGSIVTNNLCLENIIKGDTAGFDYADDIDPSSILNYFLGVQNDTTTGGIPLNSFPLLYRASDTTTSQHVCLGIYPGIRLVDIRDFTPGQEITYGADTWIVFPLKKKGDMDNWGYGGNPLYDLNTGPYGLAFKKNV